MKNTDPENLPSFEPSKKLGVANYACCDSHSCFGHRAAANKKARKPKAKK